MEVLLNYSTRAFKGFFSAATYWKTMQISVYRKEDAITYSETTFQVDLNVSRKYREHFSKGINFFRNFDCNAMLYRNSAKCLQDLAIS